MNSAYLTVYQRDYKLTKHFVSYNIIWFEKVGNDIVFKTIDNETYRVKNITIQKFKDKFKN